MSVSENNSFILLDFNLSSYEYILVASLQHKSSDAKVALSSRLANTPYALSKLPENNHNSNDDACHPRTNLVTTFASAIINCADSKESLIAAVFYLGIRSSINSKPFSVSFYLLKEGDQLWQDLCSFLLQLEHRFRSPDKQFSVSKLHIWGEASFIYDRLHSVFLVTVVSGPSLCRDHFVPRNTRAVK